jgi:hypothetical protein
MQEQIDLVAEMRDQLKSLSDPMFALQQAEADLVEAQDKLTESLETSNGEIGTQTEAQRDALDATAAYADKLDDFAEEMVGLPLDEVRDKFGEQRAFLKDLETQGLLTNEQYLAFNGLLNEAFDAIGEINSRELLLSAGLDATPDLLNFLNNINNMGGVEAFGASVGSFLGFTPMAKGGIVTGPTPILAGEAGREAIIPLNQAGNMLGGGTTINVTVQGSVLSEMDLSDAIQAQLIRTKNRNASLEFGDI